MMTGASNVIFAFSKRSISVFVNTSAEFFKTPVAPMMWSDGTVMRTL